MKPKTKLEKTVIGYADKLPVLTSSMVRQAIKCVAPHIAKLNSKNEYICMDCGHSWKAGEAKTITCPHCAARLTVEKDRKRKHTVRDYFAVIKNVNGFQVIRMFLMTTSLYKGDKASYNIGEAFQRWIAPDGKNIIISRKRNFMPHYFDAWDWSSGLELRNEHYGHSVYPFKVIGSVTVIPQLRRNGFTGCIHACNPNSLLPALLINNKIETIWKSGQYELAKYCISHEYVLNSNWQAIKITLRHHYEISDANMWFDLLRMLSTLGKDLHNPKFLCPSNLQEAHDHWHQKITAKEERDRRAAERQRIIKEEQSFIANHAFYEEREEIYRKAKSKFFDLQFVDNEIQIKPLVSIREFLDESHLMNHCVFSCKYYEKEESLILHALVNGVSIATIELNINTLEVVQCRGPYNQIPPMKDRIIKLITQNIHKIAQKRTA